MKLIEAMKELKLIEKRMEKNAEQITKYASGLSNEKEIFGSDSKQRAEVQALIQSNTDLFYNYIKLKKAIEKTNMETIVSFSIGDFSITELLVIKRKMSSYITSTYNALNTKVADSKYYTLKTEKADINIVRYYEEEEKNKNLNKWQNFFESIDGRLEVVNATTDLIEN